jgi:hypothetical protein
MWRRRRLGRPKFIVLGRPKLIVLPLRRSKRLKVILSRK